jgi:hypothetical protein
MRLYKTAADQESDLPETRDTPESTCPLCNGSLWNLNGLVRCRVCNFSMCVNCDGVPDERFNH